MKIKARNLICLFTALNVLSYSASAQVISDQPVVYSQTIISVVPGSKVPKTLGQSPKVQASAEILQEDAPEEGADEATPASDVEAEPIAENTDEGATQGVKDMLLNEEKDTSEAVVNQPAAIAQTREFRVQVRGAQIPIDQGLFINYKLDAGHAVLTYFPDSRPRSVVGENIQKPLDIWFIREDGVIAQIVPEVVPAYLSEPIDVTFPLRALLFTQAGLSAEFGIEPGYRIEHGMFRPKPLIYTTPENETNTIVVN